MMKTRYAELAGFDPDDGSDVGIRMAVLSEQVASLLEECAQLRRELFPATAGGESLERHAETRGLSRKGALFARGTLTFSRRSAGEEDLLIPQGTLVSGGGVEFATDAAATLAAGELTVQAPASACTAGAGGNLAANRIDTMVTPVVGISGVQNPAPFTGGTDEESDEQLRERLFESYRSVSNSTNSAFYYGEVTQHEFVASAAVLPRVRGRGTVDIAVSGFLEDLPQERVQQLQQSLAQKKEINVDVLVKNAVEKRADLSLLLDPMENDSFEEVKARCQAALHDYFLSQQVGESLMCARLLAALCALEGVRNVTLLSPAADVRAAADEIIRPGEIAIARMEVV